MPAGSAKWWIVRAVVGGSLTANADADVAVPVVAGVEAQDSTIRASGVHAVCARAAALVAQVVTLRRAWGFRSARLERDWRGAGKVVVQELPGWASSSVGPGRAGEGGRCACVATTPDQQGP